jgi:D-alanyl-D-alanine carboxypeptidase
MDRDKKAYEDPNVIEKYSTTVLVNQHNMLNKDFKPELVKLDKCSSEEHYLSKEAKEAYDKMCDAAISEGYQIDANSSYRDYDTQVATVNYYLKFYGENYTNKYVAKPGYSEHQTGLAIDVKSKNGSPFKTTKEYKWMVDNSYKYGFILRYPEGREEEFGYSSESWHYRYVGKEIAKYIYENNLIYDEYYALFLDK